MHELDAEPAGFLRRNIGVGLQSLIRLSQVNEMVEACLDRMPDLILEAPDGRVVAIEAKAAVSPGMRLANSRHFDEHTVDMKRLQ